MFFVLAASFICLSGGVGPQNKHLQAHLEVASDGLFHNNVMLRSEKSFGKDGAVQISTNGATRVESLSATKQSSSHGCAALKNHGSHSTVRIEIGTPVAGTAPQQFDVVADTGSDNIIVASCRCQELSGNCKNAAKCFMGQNRSETFKLSSRSSSVIGEDSEGAEGLASNSAALREVILTFGSGQIQAIVSSDVVQLAGVKTMMTDGLLLMIDAQLSVVGSFNGILGLGIPRPSASSKNAVDNLNRGFLETVGIERFSICFNQEQDGVLRLNPTESNMKLTSVGTNHWGLDFRGISVGNETAEIQFCTPSEATGPQTTPCGIVPDSGTTVMMGNKAHLISLFTQICKAWERCRQNVTELNSKNIAHHIAFQLLLADCSIWAVNNSSVDELPSLFFHVVDADGKAQTVEMTPQDYVLETMAEDIQYVTKYLMGVYPISVPQFTGNSSKVCTPAFAETDFSTPTNGPVWIWGTPLFYKFQVQYDISSSPPSMSFINKPCGSCEESHSLLATERQDIDRSRGKQLRRLKGPLRLPTFNLANNNI